MEIEERYKTIFAYLRRCETGFLVNQDIAAKLKEFIDIEDKVRETLPMKYQNKLNALKGCYQYLFDNIEVEEEK